LVSFTVSEPNQGLRVLWIASGVGISGAQLLLHCDIARLVTLLDEIASEKDNKTIIFVETKKKVENITRNIQKYG
jgi:hypothetical protein